MPKRILIHHDGGMGDILLSLPLILLIKKETPFNHVSGRYDVVCLLRNIGYLDEISSSSGILFSSLYTPFVEDLPIKFLSQFDRTFVFTSKKDPLFLKNLNKIIPLLKIITTIPPKGVRMHISEFRSMQINPDIQLPEIPHAIIPSQRLETAKNFLYRAGFDSKKLVIAIHPGSGSKRKRWQLERYFELIKILKNKYDPIFILISGPAEDDTFKDTIWEFLMNNSPGMLHVCNDELTMVAAYLSQSHIYIGNDSGVTHLASILRNNVIAIFGYTDPVLWKPLGRNVKVIRREYECSPCSDEKSKTCNEQICLSDISVDMVYKEVENLINDIRQNKPEITF
ncbi:MAG: glycosyltransferase family 9 protein [Nitrospirota bacterium]